MADIISLEENTEALDTAEDTSVYSYTHHFLRPFAYEGKTYTELTFDWDKLTGKDSLAIEAELSNLGRPVIIHSISGEYLIRMACRACQEKIGVDAFEQMRLPDYNRIRTAARNFLTKSES